MHLAWLTEGWGRALDQVLPEGGDQLYDSSPQHPDTGLVLEMRGSC